MKGPPASAGTCTGRSPNTCPTSGAAAKACGVPEKMTRPLSITQMQSASSTASARSCITTTTVRPSARMARSWAYTIWRYSASRLAVGSSNSAMGASCASKSVKKASWRSPPERLHTRLCAMRSSPVRRMARHTFSRSLCGRLPP